MSLIYISALLINLALSSKHMFENQIVRGFPDNLEFEPMYSNIDFRGTLVSSVNYNVEFDGPKGYKVFIVIGSRKSLYSKLSCASGDLDKEIIANDMNMYVKEISLEERPVNVEGSFVVVESDLYSILLFSCDEENYIYWESRKIKASGTIEFVNPYGYLPAHRYSLFSMFSLMMFVYIIFLAIWCGACYRHRKKLNEYHYYVGLIILFAEMEMVLHFFDLNSFNKNGYRSHLIYFFAKIFLILKKLVSRVVFILMCNGIGISKPKASRNLKLALIVMSLMYGVPYVALELGQDFKVKSFIEATQFFFSFVLFLCDSIFYFWGFLSLYKTINSLVEREKYKRKIYKILLAILIIGLILAAAFSTMQVNYVRERRWIEYEGWRMYWLYELGFSEIIFVYFLVTVMFALSPKREIAHYQQIEEDDNEMMIKNIVKETMKSKGGDSASDDDALSDMSELTEATDLTADEEEKDEKEPQKEIEDDKQDDEIQKINDTQNAEKTDNEIETDKSNVENNGGIEEKVESNGEKSTEEEAAGTSEKTNDEKVESCGDKEGEKDENSETDQKDKDKVEVSDEESKDASKGKNGKLD